MSVLDTGNATLLSSFKFVGMPNTTLLGVGKLVVGDGQPLYNTTILTRRHRVRRVAIPKCFIGEIR